MPTATLLLREESPSSLALLVERSQHRKPPLPEYELDLTPTQLDLVPKSKPETPDEGFESDIDTVSIVSSDGSFTPESKTTETDSANGSASSDSDNEAAATINEPARNHPRESYNLVECVCYTDVKFPDVLVFVIKQETLVFKFANLSALRNFYLNFTALKAVTNQKTYNKLSGTKFNLLQRTDNNGVTHIEITREQVNEVAPPPNDGPSSIISLNTPETSDRHCATAPNALSLSRKNIISRQRTDSNFLHHSSIENLNLVKETTLRKVWNSAEDLLNSSPKRPERRKKPKGKAPPPPKPPPQPSSIPDVLRGEYVRVNVNVKHEDFIAKSQHNNNNNNKKPLFGSSSKNLMVTLLKPKSDPPQIWTNSVPRVLKQPRSRSETRNFTPMAYRYIDTAPNYSPMGNRLFGLSPKLRDFTADARSGGAARWASVGELGGGNLKSVIKKDETRKKNEKKVTFSAYTTVQVV